MDTVQPELLAVELFRQIAEEISNGPLLLRISREWLESMARKVQEKRRSAEDLVAHLLSTIALARFELVYEQHRSLYLWQTTPPLRAVRREYGIPVEWLSARSKENLEILTSEEVNFFECRGQIREVDSTASLPTPGYRLLSSKIFSGCYLDSYMDDLIPRQRFLVSVSFSYLDKGVELCIFRQARLHLLNAVNKVLFGAYDPDYWFLPGQTRILQAAKKTQGQVPKEEEAEEEEGDLREIEYHTNKQEELLLRARAKALCRLRGLLDGSVLERSVAAATSGVSQQQQQPEGDSGGFLLAQVFSMRAFEHAKRAQAAERAKGVIIHNLTRRALLARKKTQRVKRPKAILSERSRLSPEKK